MVPLWPLFFFLASFSVSPISIKIYKDKLIPLPTLDQVDDVFMFSNDPTAAMIL